MGEGLTLVALVTVCQVFVNVNESLLAWAKMLMSLVLSILVTPA
jgi:hypothetical protein